eukprot:3684414-Alexandrium_andersonii.AAC.1
MAVLTMLCQKGSRAQRILRTVESGNGYLAWYRLSREFRPASEGRYFGMLRGLLKAKFTKEANITSDLQAWE